MSLKGSGLTKLLWSEVAMYLVAFILICQDSILDWLNEIDKGEVGGLMGHWPQQRRSQLPSWGQSYPSLSLADQIKKWKLYKTENMHEQPCNACQVAL